MVNYRVGWTTIPLAQCGVWLSGGTPNTSVSTYWDGDIPWISASSLHNFYISDSDRKVTELGIENGTRLVPKGTILFVVRGMSLKSEFRVGIARRPVTFGQDCKAIIPKPDIDPLFLANALRARAPEILAIVDEASHGTGRLQTDALGQLEIDLPPLPEQRAIAHVLGALDDKIELNRRMNQTLETMARAIFKSWFVDFDPVRAKAAGRKPDGMDAETAALFTDAFEDSALGKIPKGWEVITVADFAEIVGGSTPRTDESSYWNQGEHHWVTPKDLSKLAVPVLLTTERKITAEGLSQISSGLLPVGAILLSSRAPIGYLAISEIPVAVNQGFIAMKPKDGVSNLFLLFWAQQAHDEITSRANGSTFLEISKSNFRPLTLIGPEQNVMQTFDQTVRPMYERIVANERQSQTLTTLRDSLLPKLLSGEVRVHTGQR